MAQSVMGDSKSIMTDCIHVMSDGASVMSNMVLRNFRVFSAFGSSS